MGGTEISEFIIEVRVKEGYGARWICSQKDKNNKNNVENKNKLKLDIDINNIELKFRGFVEPMMLNGHEIGWKH